MKFTIGKWTNMFYFLPSIVWLNKEPRMFGLTWGKYYIGFDNKEE